MSQGSLYSTQRHLSNLSIPRTVLQALRGRIEMDESMRATLPLTLLSENGKIRGPRHHLSPIRFDLIKLFFLNPLVEWLWPVSPHRVAESTDDGPIPSLRFIRRHFTIRAPSIRSSNIQGLKGFIGYQMSGHPSSASGDSHRGIYEQTYSDQRLPSRRGVGDLC